MEIIDMETENDPEARLRNFQKTNRVIYIQKKIPVPGQDLGIAFLGGEHIGAYARVIGDGAWNTTINSGGHYAPHRASDETIEIARRAQAPFGLDFTTVDVVETEDGPAVFEVSAFGGFSGLKKAAGIDAADLYADYVVRTLTS
jgi:ribosomal protein S6--L-glutamate ligase